MILPNALPVPPKVDGPPDWGALQEEICCPLCEYNLRGLAEPRCPECGYRFDWRELLYRQVNEHPFLFEHHPRRNIHSFIGTLMAGWMPRRFWRTLTARHRIDLRRLRWYAVLSAITPVVLAVLVVFGWAAIDTANSNALRRRVGAAALASGRTNLGVMWRNGELWEVNWALARRGTVTWQRVGPPWQSWEFLMRAIDRIDLPQPLLLAVLCLLIWPFVTFATLMIFGASMRLANVMRGHVIRCVVYSFDCVAVVMVAALFWRPPLSVPMFRWSHVVEDGVGAMLMLLPLAWYRLGSAYSQYLRFDHPYATALASQVITLLAMIAVVIYIV